MKNKLKHILIAAAALFAVTFFAGCTSEIELELHKDGSVDVKFSGSAGNAFAALINAANNTGIDSDGQTTVVFDTQQIEYELAQNGFTNVKAVSKAGSDLTVSMTDKTGKSALFSSGVVKVENNKLSASLSPQTLKKFYDKADSQTVQFLDMLLSPVFNDEQMSQQEYLEILESFYGEEIAGEVKDSSFRITLKHPDGTKTVQTINFAKLLTLDETLRF